MWNVFKKHVSQKPRNTCHCLGSCMQMYLNWEVCPEGPKYVCRVKAGLQAMPVSTSHPTIQNETPPVVGER